MRVKCPKCDKEGYLQNPYGNYFRIRHYVYHKGWSKFRYCRVLTDWALKQKAEKEAAEQEELRRILGKP